ncbi:Asp-tRNA(Asn)/Glu-tRNA(Gln) amidotransferase subunit GatA [soil metagenome]
MTIAQSRARLRTGDLSPRDLVQSILDAAARDPGVGGYLSVEADRALAAADRADVSLPLGGIPIAIKDSINVEGEPCGCASRLLTGAYTAPYDATVIARLRAAGAIPLGRTNMDEFAMGSSTENSAIQPTRNPWDLTRIPGGSSGGSAAVVAARQAVAALGSDTGGSIRQPAAHCGVVGLKPTYGRVSRYGLVAFASSLDQVGPITQTVEDAAIVLNAIAGHDPLDSTSLDSAAPDFTTSLGRDLTGIRVGLPTEFLVAGIDPDVRAATDAAIRHLESLGAEPVEISLPHTEYAVACYYIIATAEASSNLARFDGVRYGNRQPGDGDLLSMYTATREAGFGDEVKRRILLGTYVLSSGYYDAYYLRAQKVRTLIRQDFSRAFETVDVIASPTCPTAAFPLGENTNDPLQMYLADIFTISANLAGTPGISVPCGFTADGHLPIGLQLLGQPLGEATLLQVAHAYEQSTPWHRRIPPVPA